MPTPRIRLKVDWNFNGVFTDADEDLSSDLISLSGGRGRDYASALEAASTAGTLKAVQNNFTGKYSPSNSSGPLFGSLLSNRPVLLTHEPPLGGYAHFDGVASSLTHADDIDLLNPFDGGGTFEHLMRPYSDGEANNGLVFKHGYIIIVRSESNGFVGLELTVPFSTQNGVWRTDGAVVPIHKFSRAAWVFDADSDVNAATLYLMESDGVFQTLTVGNGLNEITSPIGTRTSNAGQSIRVGGEVGAQTWDGDLDDIRLWSDIRTPTELEDNAFIEVSPSAAGLILYLKLADLVDSTGNVSDFTNSNGVTFENDHIWHGFVHDIVPIPAQRGRKVAILEAFGALAQFTEENVEMAMSTNIATGDVVDDILDELGWPSGSRDVDTGIGTLARHWTASTPALAALRAVEKSEAGFLVEERDGTIRFESRHRRLLSPHTVSQATFDDAIASTLRYHKPEQQNPRQFIRNSFTIDVRQYAVGSLAILWALSEVGANSPLLAPGESRTFKASYPVSDSPSEDVGVDAWTTPVENTDYEANTASDGSGTDSSGDYGITGVVKKGNSMAFVMTNNGSVPSFLTLVQARGTAVSQSDPISLISEDAASIAKYNKRSFNLSDHFISSSKDGQDWCDFNVSIFATEIPVLDFELWANTSVLHLFKSTRLDVSDRITFKATTLATQLGIDEDCFIETIRFTLGEDHILKTKYSVAPASGYSNFWVLGTSELGTETVLAF